MTDSDRRRRRPTTACLVCRRRKVRCLGGSPCLNCARSRRKEQCVYENELSEPQGSPALPRRRAAGVQPASDADSPDSHNAATTATLHSPASELTRTTAASISTAPSSVAEFGPAPAEDIAAMRARIRVLEEQLYTPSWKPSPLNTGTSNSQIETMTTKLGGTFHILRPADSSGPAQSGSTLGQTQSVSRSFSHKTRVFGQSHWANSVAPQAVDMLKLIEPYIAAGSCRVVPNMQRCKVLARTIKAQRAPSWPCSPNSDLPDRHIADQLVGHYLQTIETVYRILHLPSFKRDYAALWVSSADTVQLSTAFLVQLKLVLALGAVTYDDKFSLRSSAVRWVYEAKTYLSEPVFKSRLNLQTLQTQTLLLLAQELVHVAGEAQWIAAGSLIRTAIALGLHWDPSRLPKVSLLQAEMRRRLWNSVIELCLQSSVWTGGPPLLSEGDFNAQPPQNFDDEDLLDEDALPKPDGVFTETSAVRALRATFPARLKVAKSLNDLQSGVDSYEAALRLDGEVRLAFKTMRQTLQQCRAHSSVPEFAAKTLEFIMLHHLSSLHVPYFTPPLHSSAYAYSRKTLTDASLKIWTAIWSDSVLTTSPPAQPDLLSRLVICGAGFFRTGAFRASNFMVAELRSQVLEDDGVVPLREDLLAVVEDGIAWSRRCVEAGETNVKGIAVAEMIAANIEGIRKGLGKEDIGKAMVRAVEESLEWAMPILSSMAATGAVTTEKEDPVRAEGEFVDSWDFPMPDAMLVSAEDGTLDWTFEDGSIQGFSFW